MRINDACEKILKEIGQSLEKADSQSILLSTLGGLSSLWKLLSILKELNIKSADNPG